MSGSIKPPLRGLPSAAHGVFYLLQKLGPFEATIRLKDGTEFSGLVVGLQAKEYVGPEGRIQYQLPIVVVANEGMGDLFLPANNIDHIRGLGEAPPDVPEEALL